MKKMRQILMLLLQCSFFLLFSIYSIAQTIPTISPTATYIASDGTEEITSEKSGSAPIKGFFEANPQYTDGWDCYYEWRFTLEGEDQPYLIRYDENTELLFSKYGTTNIVCYATFVNDGDSVVYGEEYWMSEMQPMRCSVASSKLDMPNAFSPNGDGINDIYKAKDGWQSIIKFKAIILNRWGNKIYEWDDPSGGWDGTHNGKPVKDGVYYCLVNAIGADGIKYSYKRDVNVLRGYTERTNMQ